MIAILLGVMIASESVAPECVLAKELKLAPEKTFTGYAPERVVAERLQAFAGRCGLGKPDAATAHVIRVRLSEQGGKRTLYASVVDVLERLHIASQNADIVGDVTPAHVDAALATLLPRVLEAARPSAEAHASQRAASCRALAAMPLYVDVSAAASTGLATLFTNRLQKRCAVIVADPGKAKLVVKLATSVVEKGGTSGLRPFELNVSAKLIAKDGRTLAEAQQSSTVLGMSSDKAAESGSGAKADVDENRSPAEQVADGLARQMTPAP